MVLGTSHNRLPWRKGCCFLLRTYHRTVRDRGRPARRHKSYLSMIHSGIMAKSDVDLIRELKYAYCLHLDDASVEDFLELFTSDAVIESRASRYEGHAELRSMIESRREKKPDRDGNLKAYESVTHMALNPIIDLDGDEATGQWRFLAVDAFADGETSIGVGRYEDSYVRTGDEWKIGHSRVSRITTFGP